MRERRHSANNPIDDPGTEAFLDAACGYDAEDAARPAEGERQAAETCESLRAELKEARRESPPRVGRITIELKIDATPAIRELREIARVLSEAEPLVHDRLAGDIAQSRGAVAKMIDVTIERNGKAVPSG